MSHSNPFAQGFDHQRDTTLVAEAIEGNRDALNQLIQRHNNFIYNIAMKMLGNLEDAKDVTQEILIKLITNLSRYDRTKGQFRTWLYRIAFNYILNYKKSKVEDRILSFEQFFDFVEEVEEEESEVPHSLSEESKIKCMSGMLMCVPREDRLLYIVGDLFEVDHNLGAEIFQISPANFRKKLSRIRNNLRQWMNNRCGLINKDNPCRCARKTKGFIARGIVDPEKLVWDKDFSVRIAHFSKNNLQDLLKTSDKIYSDLYKKHPFKENQTAKQIIDNILSDRSMRELLKL